MCSSRYAIPNFLQFCHLLTALAVAILGATAALSRLSPAVDVGKY
ncbi:hypothetical protein [Nodularia sphaerocarpa]|nr:hypothetical protein [Nodularia sphaerocarpa]